MGAGALEDDCILITLTMLTTLSILLACSTSSNVSGTVTDQGKPVSDAVVWLEGPEHSKPGRATVDQRHQMFLPHIQVVPVGTRMDFPNNDDVFHNVYAEFQAKRFDLGVYPRGQSKHVTFDKPGVVSVRCNVHSQMSAYIIIVDSPYFAKTDARGFFSIKGVANHSYTVRVWHESGKTATSKISSPDVAQELRLGISR